MDVAFIAHFEGKSIHPPNDLSQQEKLTYNLQKLTIRSLQRDQLQACIQFHQKSIEL